MSCGALGILRGMARPSLYSSEYCDLVIALGAEGKSKAQMASAIGIHRETLNEWAKTYPEFSDAIARARDLAQTWWEDQAQRGIWSKEFNSATWSRSMAARFPDDYRENSKLDISNTDGSLSMSDAEKGAKIAAIMAAAQARKESDGSDLI